MDALKKMLDASEDIIEYTEVRFRSSEGFSSVKTFVSESLIVLLSLYCVYIIERILRLGFMYWQCTVNMLLMLCVR